MPEAGMAARVGDTVAHSPMLGLALAGIGVGLAIGIALVALTILSAGADVAVAGAVVAEGGAVAAEGATVAASVGAAVMTFAEWCGLASTITTATADFYTFGTWLGSLFGPTIPTGSIKTGAATVFIGPGLPAASRYQDSIDCQEPVTTYMGAILLGSVIAGPIGMIAAAAIVYANSAHTGATIDQGSRTVLTERKSQSRVGDKTSCGGAVKTGCETVFIGGPPNHESSASELPQLLQDTMALVDYLGVITGLLSGIGALKRLVVEEGWRVALFAVEGGQEVLFGLADTTAWAYEQYLKYEERQLENDPTRQHETAEDREERERLRSTIESVKQLRDGIDHARKAGRRLLL